MRFSRSVPSLFGLLKPLHLPLFFQNVQISNWNCEIRRMQLYLKLQFHLTSLTPQLYNTCHACTTQINEAHVFPAHLRLANNDCTCLYISKMPARELKILTWNWQIKSCGWRVILSKKTMTRSCLTVGHKSEEKVLNGWGDVKNSIYVFSFE